MLGVAALVLSVGTARGAHRDLVKRIHRLGSNILTVEAGSFEKMGRQLVLTQPAQTLRQRDVTLLSRSVSAVEQASGVVRGNATVVWRKSNTTAEVLGVEPEYFRIRNVQIVRGRGFSREENRGLSRILVIGGGLAESLFGRRNPVGESIRINGSPFRIIGETQKVGLDIDGNTMDATVFIPLGTASARLFHRVWLDQILLGLVDASAVRHSPPVIESTLRKAHRIRQDRPSDFSVHDPAKILAMEYQAGSLFRSLTATVAVVSLLIGGVGILSAMLMSVRERTSEIGLRRAVGARKKDIVFQFLGEAILLSGMGGLVGSAIGLFGSGVVCRIFGWTAVFPWGITGAGFLFSVALGVVSGVYPAFQAAQMMPASSLRTAE